MVGNIVHASFKVFTKITALHSNLEVFFSPHQKDIAERYWRATFDKARALLLSSKLPDFFGKGS